MMFSVETIRSVIVVVSGGNNFDITKTTRMNNNAQAATRTRTPKR
jgi:hypothetical protein